VYNTAKEHSAQRFYYDFVIIIYACLYRIGVIQGEPLIPFSDEELEPAVMSVIEKVRPSIKLDGGDITLIAIKEGKVYVQLQGACVGCGSSGTTIKFGVERQMQTLIHPEITVKNVPAGFEDKLDQLV